MKYKEYPIGMVAGLDPFNRGLFKRYPQYIKEVNTYSLL